MPVTVPIDDDRTRGLLLANTVGATPLVWNGFAFGSLGFAGVALVDSSGNQITPGALSTSPKNGQAKIASTGTAVQLGANTLVNGVIITAKSTNAAAITVGGSGVTNTVNGTGNGYILEAGASASWAVTNTNVLWINGTTGDIVSFAGS